MNHRILTTGIFALFACAGTLLAQQPADEPQKQAVPVLEKVPILGKVFKIGEPASGGGSITLNTDGSGKGKATITIEVNGKKETREIDLGNATELKIITDGVDSQKTSRVTFLGVAPEELSEELVAQLPIDIGAGLLVRSVIPDSPAAAAGIQKNDVLVKLDDQVLTAPKQLQKLVASRKPGDLVRIVYFRRGQRAEVEAKLAEHEETVNPKWEKLLNGFGARFHPNDVPPLHFPIDPLTFQKKIVVVDKDGNVVTKDDSDTDQADAIKRLAAEVERMRDQATAAQKKAQEAIQHAENVAREAAEIARKEASTAVDRMQDTIRKLQDQLDKQKLDKQNKKEP
jgi:membrane-associated protease RseP (regulator of RpoE activity)